MARKIYAKLAIKMRLVCTATDVAHEYCKPRTPLDTPDHAHNLGTLASSQPAHAEFSWFPARPSSVYMVPRISS